MNDLKVYEKLTVVKLKDWTQIVAPILVDDLLKACNSWLTFVKVWWVMVNINTIMSAEEKQWNTVDNFILSFDKEIQIRLRNIIKKRENEWLKINVEVLKNSYKSQYWADL